MKETKFKSNTYGVVLVPDFEEFSYSYRIAYMACFLYDYLKAMTFPSIGEFDIYSENRAQTVAKDIRGFIKHRQVNITLKPVKMFNLNGKFEGKNFFTVKVEMNSHLGFKEDKHLERSYHSQWEELCRKTVYGTCMMLCSSTKNIFNIRVEQNMNLLLKIKTTNPHTGWTLSNEEIFDTVLHEFVHAMDYIEAYFGPETKKYDSYKSFMRSWLAKILEHFFVFTYC